MQQSRYGENLGNAVNTGAVCQAAHQISRTCPTKCRTITTVRHSGHQDRCWFASRCGQSAPHQYSPYLSVFIRTYPYKAAPPNACKPQRVSKVVLPASRNGSVCKRAAPRSPQAVKVLIANDPLSASRAVELCPTGNTGNTGNTGGGSCECLQTPRSDCKRAAPLKTACHSGYLKCDSPHAAYFQLILPLCIKSCLNYLQGDSIFFYCQS